MSDLQKVFPEDFELPRVTSWEEYRTIAAPSHASFTYRFGHRFPIPRYLDSSLGRTAIYELPPLSGQSKQQVLIIHGLNTPALGMMALARELQVLDPDTHIVLFDLWGHGLSSTPLIAHAPHIFHFQILQVLGFMHWGKAHLIGYSFGGATLVTFATHNPWIALSAVLLAPAGLLRKEDFDSRMQELLEDSHGHEAEAIDCVLSWLEGGPLTIPEDWQDKMRSGIIVAEALRDWELREHRGYAHSVLSMFRDGGVYGSEQNFRALAGLPVRNIAVLAGEDDVCSRSQLSDLGITHVQVVENHGHAFVRTAPAEIAQVVRKFWQQESSPSS